MSTLAQETNPAPVTNKTAVSPNSNFMGAAGQSAVAIGQSLSNFYKFLRQQALQKAAQTQNVQAAAQNQAEAQRQAGKKQMMGSLFQGLGEIAAGGVGIAVAGYSGYQTAKTSTQFNDLNTKAPQILEDLSTQRGNVPIKMNQGVTENEFNAFLKDPRTIENDPDLSARLRSHNFTPEQEARIPSTLQQFNEGKAPLQEDLKGELQNLKSNLQGGVESFQYLTRGMGSLGRGQADALAAKDNAAATLDQAAQTMASGAIETISQFASQVANLIEALYQTQTALANVNR